MLYCRGFPAPQDNTNYIFHVAPPGLFPESKFSSAKDVSCLGLCKVYLQACPSKKYYICCVAIPLLQEKNPYPNLVLDFTSFHDCHDCCKGFDFDTQFAVHF